MPRCAFFRLLGSLLGAMLVATRVAAANPGAAVDRGLPFFDVFDPRDYRGHMQVWSAVEDAAGITYFGNYDGVITYDGARWGRIDVPGGTFVRALAIDAQDVLWIGGVNEVGYAARDANGRRAFVSLRDKLPVAAREFSELWRVALTARGPVFQSNGWLLRWDGRAFATLALPAGNGWQLAATDHTVWVSNAQHGWFTLHDEGAALTLVPQARPAAFANAALSFALAGTTPDEFIFGTARNGLLHWDGRAFTPFPTAVDEVLKQKRLYRGARLADGRLALTTLQGGAFILDVHGGLLARLDEAAGIPGDGTISVLAGRNDTLWICLQRGLARVDARPWLTWFGPARGAPRSVMHAPVRFRGALYTTSDYGLFRLAPAAAAAPTRLEPVPEVTDFLEGISPVGDDLLVCFGEGLVEWAGPGHPRVPLPGDARNVFDFSPSTSQPGRWFALQDGGLYTYRRDQGHWTSEGPVTDLGHVRSLTEQADGTWWMGTPSDGVLRVTFPHAAAEGPGQPLIRRYTAGHGLPAGHGWTRVSQHGGRPLLRCERGFFRLDAPGENFVPTAEYGAPFASGEMTARSLADDPRDGLWIAGRPAGEAELVSTIAFGVAGPHGWQPLHLPQLARIDDVSGMEYEASADVLWIAGHGGLVRMDLAGWRAAPPRAVPVVQVCAVENSGRGLPLRGGWELPYDRRALSVQFAAPALGGDRAALYESTLSGGGEPLVLADATPARNLSALAEGSYHLTLRARGGDGRWSAPVELAFTVLPPWWRSRWAWALYGMLGGLMVAGYIRNRTHTLRRRAVELEAVVTARTEELRRTNLELVRLNQLELDEKIAARLAEEKARLEVLRYQLNPHFLFNALTSVCSQLPPSLGGARAILERLTDFCQLTLFQPTNGESPTLAQEMKMLSAYLDIEQSRWGNLLEVVVAVEPGVADAKIPSLLLLPLVENALKYGQATSHDKLSIRLAARRDPTGALIIEIANTGQWVAPTERGIVPSLGIGHENLRQRLQRYYPGAHEFSTTVADGWVTIRLRLSTPPRE
jgi:hypothetical protein